MPYIYCFISSCFFAYKASNVKRKSMMLFYSIIAIMIPSLMGGLRAWHIGVDIGMYGLPQFWRSLAASSFAEYISVGGRALHEIGWSFVTYYSTKLFETFNWNLFVYQIITNTCVYIGAWKYRKTAPLWLIMLMFFLTQYNWTYTAMRNSVANSIVFMGIDSLEERRYTKFCVYIACATIFHSSAVVCVVYMLLLHIFITSDKILGNHQTLKTILLYMSLGLLAVARQIAGILVGMIPFLSQYQGIAESTIAGWHGVGWERALMLSGEAVMFLLYPKGAKRWFINKYEGGAGMFEYCRYIVFFMVAFRFGVQFFDRAISYLEYVNILILASLPSFIKEKNLRLAALAAVIGAALLVWWHFNVYKSRFFGYTYPYSSILD